MMHLKTILVAFLSVCFFKSLNADLPMIMQLTGMFVDHAADAGLSMKGYMRLLSNKSNFLTNLVHYIFGDKLERRFKKIIDRDIQFMPEVAPIEDVTEPKEMSFVNGRVEGLKSMAVPDQAEVDIMWSWTWAVPTAVVPIYFKRLVIKGDAKKKSGFPIPFLSSDVDGPVEMKVLANNFVLTFKLHPGLFEWCYLKLTDVIVTDMDELEWHVKHRTGGTNIAGGLELQDLFVRQEGVVEQHIKSSVVNMIYHALPLASPAICDNHNQFLRLSEFQTHHKKKATVLIDGQTTTQKAP